MAPDATSSYGWRGEGTVKRVLALVVMAVVGTAAAAFACTNISTLNLSDSAGRPGESVLVTGASFGNSSPTGRRTTTPLPVRIRWNSVEGPTLAEVAPDGTGNISASITIPEASPGRYVIFAVQQDADGYHMYGTPARIDYEVLTPEGRSAPPLGAPAATPSGGSAGTADLPLALVVLGLLGGALFVVGFVSFAQLLGGGRPTVSRVPSK